MTGCSDRQQVLRPDRCDSSETLLGSSVTEALVKTIDSTRCIDHFLLTRVKWVALGTNFQVNIFTHGRFGLDDIAAATGRSNFFVLGMDISFHVGFCAF
jgi:hypothetical protein